MKRLLTWLTLLTTGAIVVVLVAYLVPTAVALIRANRNLARLVERLEAIRDNTAPLSGDLPAINEAATALQNRLSAVDEHLQTVVQRLKG